MTPDTFEQHRQHLFGVAYRMLGSASEAEDVVQDAFLRVRDAEPDNPRGFLVTVVSRLALDVLGSARARRESYVGPWLPEPVPLDAPDALDAAGLRETLSFAFLHMAERLSPVERAVVVLHDAFELPFAEIAPIVGKTDANCRQIHRRARAHLGEAPRRTPPKDEQQRILVAFLGAVQTGDLHALEAVFAEDVIAWSDGGGVTYAARVPIEGAAKVAKFVVGLRKLAPPGDIRVTFEPVNGQLALLIWVDDALVNLTLHEFDAGRIQRSRSVVNPAKLAYFLAHRQVSG